jgi:RHS repeat-associated protein
MRPTRWDISNVLGYNYNYDYFNEHTGRVTYAQNIQDGTLDRSYEYDQAGRLVISHSGAEARAHAYSGQWGTMDGPYSQGYDYDVWGNVTHKYGWGGEVQGGGAGQSSDIYYSYTNNRRNGFSYDSAVNLTNDIGQTFTYDATGQQATASYGGYSLTQNYDGDGLRVKKSDNGTVTYYLRSSVLGGQVVAEMNIAGGWTRGYVYLGSQLLAVQQAGVFWMHEDPVTKSKRVTNSAGTVVSTIETDPWGADTNRSSNAAFQPKKFTSYERDGNGTDEAMFRRYNRWQSRFDQPDPYDGSYDATDPQSFNRYAYTQNDPVNFTDPTGLEMALTCMVDGMVVNCSTAFGLVNSGAGTVGSGPGFYGDVLVVNHEPTFDGGRLYQSLYFFFEPFAPQDPVPQPHPSPTPAPIRPTKPPCNHVGSGQGDINFGKSRAGVGPTVGAQITANKLHLYGGMQVGLGVPPQGSASLMVRNGTDISPGLNYSFGAGSVVGFSYSGKLNLGSLRAVGSSLRNGSFSFGGTTPGVGASVVWVTKGWQIPCL